MFADERRYSYGPFMAPVIGLSFVVFFVFFKLAFRFLSYNFFGVKEMFLEYYNTRKVRKILKWVLSQRDKQEFISDMEFHAGVLGVNPATWTVPQIEKAFRKNMKKFKKRLNCQYDSDFSTPIQPQIERIEKAYWFFKNEFEF